MNAVVMQLVDLGTAEAGFSLLTVGLLALLLWAAVKFNNPAAMVMWCLSVLVLLAAGIYELGDDIFWLSCMLTVIVLVIGISMRMGRG